MKNQFKITLLLSNVLTTKFTKNWSKAHENNKQKSKIGEALLSVNLSHENVLYAYLSLPFHFPDIQMFHPT